MSKTIYEEALELLNDGCDGPQAFDTYKTALEQAQKREKLLKLYDKLADHRLRFIHNLLDEITWLKEEFDVGLDDMIDDIMVEAKNYGSEDYKIVREIAKIKEIENE